MNEMANPKLGPVIAIDGPAGTGKSSVTLRLCSVLGFVHVDTGALYRSVAFLVREKKLIDHFRTNLRERILGNQELSDQIVEIARNIHIEFKRIPDLIPANRVFANGLDISNEIRTPEMSLLASAVSAIPGVRASLLGLQRKLGCQGKAILEGRDIGTVIFPDADVKFYLTASPDERAKRRLAEIEATGVEPPSYEELKTQMLLRDQEDMNRKVAPLKKAEGAIEFDTTHLTLDQVVSQMEGIIKKCLATPKKK